MAAANSRCPAVIAGVAQSARMNPRSAQRPRLPDVAERRIDDAVDGRLDLATQDSDIAERTVVHFAQHFDGFPAGPIGDEAVRPASEQTGQAGSGNLTGSLGCRLACG